MFLQFITSNYSDRLTTFPVLGLITVLYTTTLDKTSNQLVRLASFPVFGLITVPYRTVPYRTVPYRTNPYVIRRPVNTKKMGHTVNTGAVFVINILSLRSRFMQLSC